MSSIESLEDIGKQELDGLIVGWEDYLRDCELYPHVQTMDTMRAEHYLDMLHGEVKRREAA